MFKLLMFQFLLELSFVGGILIIRSSVGLKDWPMNRISPGNSHHV